MILVLLTLALAPYADSMPAAPTPSEPRAIDRVMSDAPSTEAAESKDALTDKVIAACLQAHGGDATLCRSRATLDSGENVSRQRVEQQKERLDPVAPRSKP
jgi:hypothetical protein